MLSKPTQGFQDIDEDDFNEKETAKRALANDLRKQMEEDRQRKAEEKRLFKLKQQEEEERLLKDREI